MLICTLRQSTRLHLQESVLELPRELRQLVEMRRERQEWAVNHYPVTEQGLLSRFNPRTQSPAQTSPAAQEHSQTQADSSESPSSTIQEISLLQKTPTSPLSITDVTSADVHASPDLPAQAPVPAALSDLRKEMPVRQSLGLGRGCIEVLNDTIGRGRPLGKAQPSLPALPAVGRGLLLQMPQAQIPRQFSGDMKTPDKTGTCPSSPNQTPTQEVVPLPSPGANDLLSDTSASSVDHLTPTSLSRPLSLKQSFRFFRY